MLMSLFHWFRLEISQNRLARFLNSNRVHEWFHPQGWEPQVLKRLMDGDWCGPVWDVGASLGRHAYRVSRRHQVIAFEPNLNVLQYLGYNTLKSENLVVVPCALTLDGAPMKGSIHADFMASPSGPRVATLSVAEALQKFGKPGLIKIDIEGGEYELIESEALHGISLLIEWHREIPRQLAAWTIETIDETHSLLIPKEASK